RNADRATPVTDPKRRNPPVADPPVDGRLRDVQTPRHLRDGEQFRLPCLCHRPAYRLKPRASPRVATLESWPPVRAPMPGEPPAQRPSDPPWRRRRSALREG